jgi:hypothetical protein
MNLDRGFLEAYRDACGELGVEPLQQHDLLRLIAH